MPQTGTITSLVNRLSAGELLSRDDMFPVIYAELRGMARHRLRYGHYEGTPTDLVNMVYVKLFGGSRTDAGDVVSSGRWENRAHFFGAAARAMEHLLVDDARRKRVRRKHLGSRVQGGATADFSLDAEPRRPMRPPPVNVELLAAALKELEAQDSHLAEVVRLRIFLGHDVETVAQILQQSVRTVQRDLAIARAWLQRRLRQLGLEGPEMWLQ